MESPDEVLRGAPAGASEANHANPFEHALGIAYSFLNRRDRTVHEVRVRLQRAAVEAQTIADVIETLIEQHFLDDARYARLFAEDKRNLAAWGSDRIERVLHARGIPRELVEEAIAGATPESELDRAISLLRRRFPAAPENRRDRDRALGVLLRKGYGSELALDALAIHRREAEAA